MLQPRHPHHPPGPPLPPQPHHPPGQGFAPPPGMPYPQAYPPPPQGLQLPTQGNYSQPLLKETDLELLQELLNNTEEAQALYYMLQNSPPEIASLGYLILRVFERTKS